MNGLCGFCIHCNKWLSDCTCITRVGFLPAQETLGTNPRKTQFAGEKDCSIDHGPTIEISPARQASQGYAGTTPGQAPCSAGVACDSHGHSSVRGPVTLDDKGRCCGRKPIDYKGGAWNSPVRPEKFCTRCSRAYDRVTGEQIENWAHKACPGCGTWIAGSSSACGECACEQEDCA